VSQDRDATIKQSVTAPVRTNDDDDDDDDDDERRCDTTRDARDVPTSRFAAAWLVRWVS
jgi:hypothetical protein